jgi:hypothetical protein
VPPYCGCIVSSDGVVVGVEVVSGGEVVVLSGVVQLVTKMAHNIKISRDMENFFIIPSWKYYFIDQAWNISVSMKVHYIVGIAYYMKKIHIPPPINFIFSKTP